MSDDDSIDIIREKLEKAFDRDDIAVTDRDQNLSYATFDAEVRQHKAMGLMFAVVFLAIALLGIVTTMARVTASQRTIIGTMKALGFSKARITFHYVSYGFAISALGCIAGGLSIEEAESFGGIAADIGIGFQIIDDVINLTSGNPGKERGDGAAELRGDL